jgi:proteasome lid subunit RPN8/RPN11
MIAHAVAEMPNECCGLLGGKRGATPQASGLTEAVQALRSFPLVNAAASPREYVSEPRSMFDAVRAMDDLGLEMVAIYHSHPYSPPVPSRRDREESFQEGFVNIIISPGSAPPDVEAWWISPTESRRLSWVTVEDLDAEKSTDPGARPETGEDVSGSRVIA